MTVQVTDATRGVLATPHRFGRLMLRDELYLIAHGDNGTPLINEQALEVGLAGAVVLDLWLAKRVAVGWVAGPQHSWVPTDGALTVCGQQPVDDLGRVALAVIRHVSVAEPSEEHLKQWLRGFAGIDVYARTQAAMTVAGILRRAVHRGRHVYLPCEAAWPARARAMVREAANKRAEPDPANPGSGDLQLGGLCGLVEALQLTEFLYDPNLSTRSLARWLRQVLAEQHPDIQAVVGAVDSIRGDLAVAAMR